MVVTLRRGNRVHVVGVSSNPNYTWCEIDIKDNTLTFWGGTAAWGSVTIKPIGKMCLDLELEFKGFINGRPNIEMKYIGVVNNGPEYLVYIEGNLSFMYRLDKLYIVGVDIDL